MSIYNGSFTSQSTENDLLALETAKARIEAFSKSDKPKFSFYSKRRKMLVKTTNEDYYNKLKAEEATK
ncbi:MAG: hypothetical protein ACRDCN_11155 [Tannerellaceae bacterium]